MTLTLPYDAVLLVLGLCLRDWIDPVTWPACTIELVRFSFSFWKSKKTAPFSPSLKRSDSLCFETDGTSFPLSSAALPTIISISNSTRPFAPLLSSRRLRRLFFPFFFISILSFILPLPFLNITKQRRAAATVQLINLFRRIPERKEENTKIFFFFLSFLFFNLLTKRDRDDWGGENSKRKCWCCAAWIYGSKVCAGCAAIV